MPEIPGVPFQKPWKTMDMGPVSFKDMKWTFGNMGSISLKSMKLTFGTKGF